MRKIGILNVICMAAVMLACFCVCESHAYTAKYNQIVEMPDTEPALYKIRLDNDNMRMETESGGEVQITFIKGDGIFNYFPRQNTYMKVGFVPKWPEGLRDPVDYAGWVRKNTDKESMGTQYVGAYQCDVYRYRDEKSGSIVTVWLLQGKDFPAKMVFAGGLIEGVITFHDIILNEKLPPDTFEIPKGAKEFNPNSLGAMFDAMRDMQDEALNSEETQESE